MESNENAKNTNGYIERSFVMGKVYEIKKKSGKPPTSKIKKKVRDEIMWGHGN